MVKKVTLNKEVYNKDQFKNTINTDFTQLVNVISQSPNTSLGLESTISVNEFFTYYQELFFRIPRLGDTNSHEYLIKTSTDYIGYSPENSETQALIEEITQLRQENLTLQQQIYTIQTQYINNITGSI